MMSEYIVIPVDSEVGPDYMPQASRHMFLGCIQKAPVVEQEETLPRSAATDSIAAGLMSYFGPAVPIDFERREEGIGNYAAVLFEGQSSSPKGIWGNTPPYEGPLAGWPAKDVVLPGLW